MSFEQILVLFWMTLALIQWWRVVRLRKKARQADQMALRSFWGGYFAALMNEGYSKGDATKKTLLQIRRVRDRGND